MSKQVQGYVFLSLAMVLVGSTVIASKIIAAGLPPFTATALRFAIAFPLFLGLMRATGASWPSCRRAIGSSSCFRQAPAASAIRLCSFPA